jgi:purine-binding chemotaxis protein CheW
MAADPPADGLALTFSVGGERLALDASDVAEVLRPPPLRRVPLAPPALAGVANLRGSVIPIVSLAALLGRSAGEGDGRIIVIEGEAPVGLIVDHVASLVPAARIRSGEEPARYLALDPLLGEAFGSLRRTGRGAAVATPPADAPAAAEAEHSFLSFEIAGQEFALPLASVQEVIPLPAEIARVPDSDAAMLGLVSLRDRLLPLLSLSVLLGLGKDAESPDSRVVVALAGGIRLGLVVNRVRAIVRAGDAQIDPVPPVLVRGRQEARIQSVCRLEGGRRLVSVLSTDHLLEEGLLERLASGQQEESEVVASDSGATEQFVIFELGDESYGLPIASVEEVIRAPDKLTRLPRAPAFVEGVLNVRGRVIPVIDQRRRFGSAGAGARRGRIIVVRIGEAEAGFLVDGVSQVLRVPVDALRGTPAIAARDSRVIDRIANLEVDGRMYLLIDPQELLDRAEQDMLAGLRGDMSAPS